MPERRPESPSALDRARLARLHQADLAHYRARHPACAAHAAAAAPHFLYGLPMHWMRDWALPHAMTAARAEGHRLWCADGHEHVDFCLGDTGAMFGHSPPPVAEALAAQARDGLTAMLPGVLLAEVGAALAATFGLPRWQLALSASDANRFVLRWTRAITGRAKVLVFEGCYHGTVDDTLVDRADDGRTLTRSSLLGQVHDLAQGTVVVPFNDLDAVRDALARGDVACVLTEPALTNCGLVPPLPGFLEGLQAACRQHGTLFVLDETHTVSTAHGGHARMLGLSPDVLVVGKAVAGGLPCAVYGFSDDVARRMAAAKQAAPEGHSGIGTTLSASLLALAALKASLAELMVPATYDLMLEAAARLQRELDLVIAEAGLPWCISRLGARMELQFCPRAPRSGREAMAAMDEPLEQALRLHLLNRGVLSTPFHTMLLVAPTVDDTAIGAVVGGMRSFLHELA